MNLDTLKAIGADDKDVMQHLANLYTEQSIQMFADMEAAINNCDITALKSSAHTFKGVCLNLGFNELSELCKALEVCANTDNFRDAEAVLKNLKEAHKKVCDAIALL